MKATRALLVRLPVKDPEPEPLPIWSVPWATVEAAAKVTSFRKVTVPAPVLVSPPEATIAPPEKVYETAVLLTVIFWGWTLPEMTETFVVGLVSLKVTLLTPLVKVVALPVQLTETVSQTLEFEPVQTRLLVVIVVTSRSRTLVLLASVKLKPLKVVGALKKLKLVAVRLPV